ncbi:hypothetical protein BDR03DRAFT_423242 [Suillus americanus]|nr:hypothetical protein BDR03DRAFT_423242 [Suillus americanus]
MQMSSILSSLPRGQPMPRSYLLVLFIFASWKSDNGQLVRSARRYLEMINLGPERITCAHSCTNLGVSQDLQASLSPTGIIWRWHRHHPAQSKTSPGGYKPTDGDTYNPTPIVNFA